MVLPGADKIRKVWHQEQWFYSVVDIIAFLTESKNPQRYWSDLKRRVSSEGFEQLYEKCVRLKMPSSDGKAYLTDAADRETIFRIVQSVPSPRAEPLKCWLAEAGEQRLQTLERTQVDIEAERRKYRLKGYSEEWIEKRIQSILVRNELTQEWDERSAEKKDYGLLTDTIARGTFEVNT
jgi:DNA-damage-inducible protein D